MVKSLLTSPLNLLLLLSLLFLLKLLLSLPKLLLSLLLLLKLLPSKELAKTNKTRTGPRPIRVFSLSKIPLSPTLILFLVVK